jgi:hypothetical protein
MSARSFAHDLGVIAAPLACFAAAACSTDHKPEADPARVAAIMKTIDRNTPGPGDVPDCKPADMIGGATMTQLTMLKIGGIPATPGAERDDWINPAELDSPAARELLDPAVPEITKRQAAYELLSAPFYLVYRVDLVEAPMAMGIKDLRRGVVSMRALRYDRQGKSVCGKFVTFQQTLAKSDWAIVKSDLAVMDPKVAKVLRDDLHEVMLKHVAALGRAD